MSQQRRPQRWWVQALVVLRIWTVLGLIHAAQSYFFHALRGQQGAIWSILAAGMSDWYVWALLTPFIAWPARRYPLERAHWGRMLFHAAASVGSALTVLALSL